MGSDALLTPDVSVAYHRAYGLATEMARGGRHLVAQLHRTSLAEDWMLFAILGEVLRRLDRADREDAGLILRAVRDALESTRPATAGSTDPGLR
jgi:hypothetical protein